jgi:hypothetical protein
MSNEKLPKLDETAVEEIPSADLDHVAGGAEGCPMNSGGGCAGALTCQDTCMAHTNTKPEVE